MKQLLCLLLCCMLLVLPACAEETSVNSWSQINQSVSKGADWQQADTDGSFHLGEKKPLAGYENLYIGDWGTYPSMDGSTVCVPMAMELARQWLGLEEGDMNGFVNFSTTPYAYDRLTQGKSNPLARPNGGEGGFQAHHAHHGGDDAVRAGRRCRFQQPRLSPVYPDGQVANPPGQFPRGVFRCHDRQLRPKLPALLRHTFHVGARS